MSNDDLTYIVVWHFDNPVFDFLARASNPLTDYIKSEYVRLRNIACDELHYYNEWNEEFGDRDVHEDDKLKDFGGTEYCNFIRDKQEPILKAINEKHGKGFVSICSGETCDIEGIVSKKFGNLSKDVHFYITLKKA